MKFLALALLIAAAPVLRADNPATPTPLPWPPAPAPSWPPKSPGDDDPNKRHEAVPVKPPQQNP